jgi:hypothetical protein
MDTTRTLADVAHDLAADAARRLTADPLHLTTRRDPGAPPTCEILIDACLHHAATSDVPLAEWDLLDTPSA